MARYVDIGDAVNKSAPLNRGLVSWWLALPGQQRGVMFRDLMGRNHGTLTNGPTWQGARGRPSGWGALSFDGSDDVVNCGIITPSGYYTISCFANIDSSDTSESHLVCNDNGSTIDSRIWQFRKDGSTNVLRMVCFTAGVGLGQAGGATALNGTGWRHLAGTWDGSNIYIYVDGVQDGTAALSGSLSNVATHDLSIGFGRTGGNAGGSPTLGYIDDVRIFNRALSASEVSALYQASRTGYQNELNWRRRYTVFDVGGGAPATTSRARFLPCNWAA